jgi:hypothetical protein
VARKANGGGTVVERATALLQRKGGATLAELMERLGFQAHSVRGLISIMGSKHGMKIESENVDGVRRYRLR